MAAGGAPRRPECPRPTGAVEHGLAVGGVVTEIGSALKGRGRRSLALLREATVTPIVVEHRDRLARFGAEEVEAALAAQGRRLGVVDPSEVDDDLVRDGTELLSRLGARLDGRRAAAHRVARAMAALQHDGPQGCPTRVPHRSTLRWGPQAGLVGSPQAGPPPRA